MNIALLYIRETIASTVYDHLNSFQKYGNYNYTYLNVFKDDITLEYINQFDFILIHYTISIFNDDRCPPWLRLLLQKARAKKIVFIQDEYRFINDVIENLNFIKASLLYTCVPIEEIEKVYPKEKLPNLIKINTLTGFVPENLLTLPRVPYEERKVDVVYRARKLSAWYGRLGQEKWIIAERFARDAKKYGLVTDISYQEKKRIYGNDWVKFLQGAKAAIGCESGASVFDFSGSIQKSVEKYEKENPLASFEEIEERFFKDLDGLIRLNQISPRCFECAAVGTLMILYEGDYSNILKPWRHYIPLKKDHSNMDEIIHWIRCPEKWQAVTTWALEEIALNKFYSCQHFIQKFEQDLNQIFTVISCSKEEGYTKNNFSEIKLVSNKKYFFCNVTNILRYLLKKVLGEKNKETLIVFKRRIMLAIRTFLSIIKNDNKGYLKYILKKDFCEEYQFIQEIKEYVSFIQKKIHQLPLVIKKEASGACVIIISNSMCSLESVDFAFSELKSNKITIKIEDSLDIPKRLRGKLYHLKFPVILVK